VSEEESDMSTNCEPKSVSTVNTVTEEKEVKPARVRKPRVKVEKEEQEQFNEDGTKKDVKDEAPPKKRSHHKKVEKSVAVETETAEPAPPAESTPKVASVAVVEQPVQVAPPAAPQPEPPKKGEVEDVNEDEDKDGESEGEDEEQETSEEALEDAQINDLEFQKKMSELPRHEQIRRQKARNRVITSNRRSRKTAAQDKNRAEHNEMREAGRPEVKITIPDPLICSAHAGEVLKLEDAYSLNSSVVYELTQVSQEGKTEAQTKILKFVVSKLAPLFRFNCETIPAYCKTVVDVLAKNIAAVQPLIAHEKKARWESRIVMPYAAALRHFAESKAAVEGKQQNVKDRQNKEAWAWFDENIGKFHAELVGLRSVEEIVGKIDILNGLNDKCLDTLRHHFLETLPVMRYSEPGKMLGQLLRERGKKYEQVQIEEQRARKAEADEKRRKEEEKALAGLGELEGLFGGEEKQGEEQDEEPSERDENEKRIGKWLEKLVGGKMHSAAGLMTPSALREIFAADPGAEVYSACPFSQQAPGTQYSTYVNRKGDNEPLFATVTVPTLVVETDDEGQPICDGKGRPKPWINPRTSKTQYEGQIAVLTKHEARWAASIRIRQMAEEQVNNGRYDSLEEAINGIHQEVNQAKTNLWAAKKEFNEAKVSGDQSRIDAAEERLNQAKEVMNHLSDDRRPWYQGMLEGSLGVLKYYDLKNTVEMLNKPREERPAKRNTRGGGTHGNYEQEQSQGASAEEQEAFFRSQNNQSFANKARQV